ncbi:MAG: hypothetical protein O3B73_05240 [bacterium]|nr:hypothetical protein [bacterium]
MISTLRSSLIIIALTVFSAYVAQQVELVYGGPYIAGGIFPFTVVLPALPIGLLALLLLFRRWLPVGERAVIYAALAIGVTVTGSGLMHRFLPGLVTGHYGGFASTKGKYYPYLVQFPEWMVPGEPNSQAAVSAFEGDALVPWDAWAAPLVGWTFFFLALFLTSLCLALLLRDRWIETERLSFPLLDLPIVLLDGEADHIALFRNRAFLWGMVVPALIYGINGVSHYFPALGKVGTGVDLQHFLLEEPWKALTDFESPFVFSVSPFLIGISFLMSVEVSLSTWVIFLVTRFQFLVTDLMGLTEYRGNFLPNGGSVWLDWPMHFPFLMSQARGGLMVIAVYSLWSARSVFHGAWRNPAAWGFVIGIGGLWIWTMAIGLPPWMGFLALILFLIFSLAFVRMRIDGGLPVTQVYVLIGIFFLMAMGSGPEVLSNKTAIGIAFLAVLGYTTIGVWPAFQFEGLKLAERFNVSRGRMIWGMCLGLLAGLTAGYYFALNTMYDHGIFALQEQGGARVETRIGRYYSYLYTLAGDTEAAPDWERLWIHVGGGVFTAFLIVMRQRFLRWPFHPMGFVFGTGFGWMMWGSAFLGWLCKWLTVRYGGASTYRRIRPFFLGMIFGEIGMRLFWAGVAYARGEMGMGYDMPFMTEY